MGPKRKKRNRKKQERKREVVFEPSARGGKKYSMLINNMVRFSSVKLYISYN